MVSAQKVIDLFESEIQKNQRRLNIVRDFEKDRESFYEIMCKRVYHTHVTSMILVKVAGYLTDGVSFKFYAGNGSIAEEMCVKRWKRLRRSIKYEQICDYKRVSDVDLPLYVGCDHIVPSFKDIIRRYSNG